jgi:hypothetical protein
MFENVSRPASAARRGASPAELAFEASHGGLEAEASLSAPTGLDAETSFQGVAAEAPGEELSFGEPVPPAAELAPEVPLTPGLADRLAAAAYAQGSELDYAATASAPVAETDFSGVATAPLVEVDVSLTSTPPAPLDLSQAPVMEIDVNLSSTPPEPPPPDVSSAAPPHNPFVPPPEAPEEIRFAEDEGPSAPPVDQPIPPRPPKPPQVGETVEAVAHTYGEPAAQYPVAATATLELSEAEISQENSWAPQTPRLDAQPAFPEEAPLAAPVPEAAVSSGATEGAQPYDGVSPFLINEDGVVVTVQQRLHCRADSLIAMRGAMGFTPEVRRFRGRPLETPFGEGPRQMQRVEGTGTLLLAKGKGLFMPLRLGEQSGYFSEDVVYAFEEALTFENGKVPSELAPDVHIVHLSGEGEALLQLEGVMRTVEVHVDAPVTVPLRHWAGWYGNLSPRIVALPGPSVGGRPAAGMELSGEGYALLMAPHG